MITLKNLPSAKKNRKHFPLSFYLAMLLEKKETVNEFCTPLKKPNKLLAGFAPP